MARSAAGQKAPLHTFDWVRLNSTLELKRDTRAILVLLDGHRYVMEGPARAVVQNHLIQKLSGVVRELPALPALPKIVGIAGQGSDSSEAAVTGVRDVYLPRRMFPRDPFRTLPDATSFQFETAQKGLEHEITVADESGAVLWRVRRRETTLPAPPGLLKAGRRYVWRVQALGDIGNTLATQAYFKTLEQKELDERKRLTQFLASDPDSLAVLAAIDWKLGLLENAVDEIRAAMKRAGHPQAYRALLQEMEKDLYGK